jgi:hypothetical protein
LLRMNGNQSWRTTREVNLELDEEFHFSRKI